MCFNVDKKHPHARTAKRAIVCFKVVNRDLCSYYQGFGHEYGFLAKSRLKKEKRGTNGTCIYMGFHSYTCFEAAMKEYRCKLSYDPIVVRCLLPRGTRYYYDSCDHEFVSNRIVVERKVLG